MTSDTVEREISRHAAEEGDKQEREEAIEDRANEILHSVDELVDLSDRLKFSRELAHHIVGMIEFGRSPARLALLAAALYEDLWTEALAIAEEDIDSMPDVEPDPMEGFV